MKRVIYAIIVLIVLGTVWLLYLRWENKRFAESLPKAPSRTNIEKSSNRVIQDRAFDNENRKQSHLRDVLKNSELSAETNVSQVSTTRYKKASTNMKHTDPHNGEPNSHVSNDIFYSDLESESESNVLTSFLDLSVDEIIERRRQKLIKEHGNIPEIDIYLKYTRKVYEAVKSGESQVNMTMTPEEHLEFSRTMAYFFPSEKVIKMYQDASKTMEKLKR